MVRVKLSAESKKIFEKKVAQDAEARMLFLGKSNSCEIKELSYVCNWSGHEEFLKTAMLRPGDVIICNHPDGEVSPSPAEIRFAAELEKLGVGMVITDNRMAEQEIIIMPEQVETLTRDEIQAIFEPEGPLGKHLPGYEYRSQQLKMAEGVRRSFNQNRHLLVEAGTGTGKTFAYLVPALLYSLQTGEKIVISTNTINLQEQLIEKDLPDLISALGHPPIKALLVKGRSNYLCRRRLDHQLRWNKDSLSDKNIRLLLAIVNVLPGLEEGTKQELGFPVPERVWKEISSQRERCMRAKCPYNQMCFFNRARNKIQSADILIVNHHLLFSDLKLKLLLDEEEHGVLPVYKYLVIDEAHNVEEVATEYFGYDLKVQEVQTFFSRLYERKTETGFLIELRKLLAEKGKAYLELLDNLILKVLSLYEQFSSLVSGLDEHLGLKTGGRYRLKEDFFAGSFYRERISSRVTEFLRKLEFFISVMRRLQRILENTDLQEEEELLNLELRAYIGFGQLLYENINFILHGFREGFVTWVEKNNDYNLSFLSRPIKVAQYLKDQLFSSVPGVILTSATLTVRGSFDFIKEHLGLTDLEVDELIIGSPFDYERQVLLEVIKDLPDFHDPLFLDRAVAAGEKIIRCLEGNCLFLFTSYQMLRNFGQRLKEVLPEEYTIYMQGELPRSKIIRAFKKNKPGVILGTDSFWEGVDLKGEDLQGVVLVKLPFAVPDDPVVEAKCEVLSREGRNPFWNYSLPKAVIKFRQGFGRLVRSREDRGVVIVLDSRINRKSYGAIFLKSLPPGVDYHLRSTNDFHLDLEEFIKNTL